jgi:asparagine N-glycosylation enzyme membrane subunit Stt3
MTARARVRWAVVSGVAAFAAALFWRHFSLGQSVVVGVAVGLLVGTSLATAERLRTLYRPPSDPR